MSDHGDRISAMRALAKQIRETGKIDVTVSTAKEIANMLLFPRFPDPTSPRDLFDQRMHRLFERLFSAWHNERTVNEGTDIEGTVTVYVNMLGKPDILSEFIVLCTMVVVTPLGPVDITADAMCATEGPDGDVMRTVRQTEDIDPDPTLCIEHPVRAYRNAGSPLDPAESHRPPEHAIHLKRWVLRSIEKRMGAALLKLAVVHGAGGLVKGVRFVLMP
jgi:hypothetical protein